MRASLTSEKQWFLFFTHLQMRRIFVLFQLPSLSLSLSLSLSDRKRERLLGLTIPDGGSRWVSKSGPGLRSTVQSRGDGRVDADVLRRPERAEGENYHILPGRFTWNPETKPACIDSKRHARLQQQLQNPACIPNKHQKPLPTHLHIRMLSATMALSAHPKQNPDQHLQHQPGPNSHTDLPPLQVKHRLAFSYLGNKNRQSPPARRPAPLTSIQRHPTV